MPTVSCRQATGQQPGAGHRVLQQALRFLTPEAAPLEYAATQNNLGAAYGELPTGDRGANLTQAIDVLPASPALLHARDRSS